MYQLIIAACLLGVAFSVSVYHFHHSDLKHCLDVKPQPNVSFSQLVGTWYLALVQFEHDEMTHYEETLCVEAEFKLKNETTLQQLWVADSATYATAMEVTGFLVKPGVWKIDAPITGNMMVTVTGYDPSSHISLAFCSGLNDELAHIWTVILTRDKLRDYTDLLRVTSSLEKQGVSTDFNKLVTFKQC